MKHETINEKTLSMVIRDNYEFNEELQCQLIRSGFNHTYLVEASQQRYVFRVYLNGKYYIRDADDFRFELDLLDFLSANNIRVACPIANQQGEWLTTFSFDGEIKYAALFTFAEGRVFDGNGVKESDIHRIGELAAKLHCVADKYQSKYHRYHLNLTHLLDEPLRTLEKHLLERNMSDLAFFKPVAEELRQQIERLPLTASEYGIIHGDLIGSNLHLDRARNFTLIDFDHCAYGWRAYELAPWGYLDGEALSLVVDGYESVRALSREERGALPAFVKLREIWDCGDILKMKPVWGEPIRDEELSDFVKFLHGLM